ncbi:MAG TPA: pre-peptidase C-terminal domain-containing protein, partial [Anaerolineales bacterium]
VFQQTYLSNNYYMGDSIPPTGGLSGVTQGAVVRDATLTLYGWGSDGQTGLDYGQLTAYFDGHWNNLGPQFKPDITYTWNLCDPSLPVADGPVSVAVRLYDVAGNPSSLEGLRHFTKDYACPVPPTTCIPGPDQVTLFEDSYFQGGCVLYGQGNYPMASSLNPLGNNDAESILVGDNVLVTLYSEENFTGHSQAVLQDTGFMKYLWTFSNTVSSMRVSPRASLPSAPILENPAASAIFRLGDVIPLAWTNGGGAVDYQIEIYAGAELTRSFTWQTNPVLYVDSLAQGSYTWRVQGRNAAGASPWSQSFTFTIASPLTITTAIAVPYTDTMETSQFEWVNTGQWAYKSLTSLAHSGSHSWWYQNSLGNYDNGESNYGFLTSPRFSIPSAGYYLRFYYRNETETQGTTWDQRWVQVSVNDGPFTNLVELYDDPKIGETSSWMLSKAADLSAYAGRIIRIRFQFSTLDSDANQYAGWGIDDFSITATPPSACSETRQDDTPGQAFLLNYDTSITMPGKICPNGDYDYYTFFGNAGDRIVADIDATINGSPLDAYLFLIDGDGQTVLTENDDEVYGQRRDPLISYTLPADGRYYLKLRAWKHP